MTRAEESALIFKIMEGDKDLFRQLVDAHSGMIFSVLYRVTGSREDAEDLAQETFVKAYFSLGKYRGESSISTWLYSIAGLVAEEKEMDGKQGKVHGTGTAGEQRMARKRGGPGDERAA